MAGTSQNGWANVASIGTELYSPIKKRRVFEDVCEQIRARIYEESLRPGDKLPPERELAQRLGVGRAAVREALRSLENAGILHLLKGQKGGAFIQHFNPQVMSTSVRDMIYLGNVTLDDLIETRMLMNDMVIPLVCERATTEDLDALEKNVIASESATGLTERLAYTRQFYQLLGLASHNHLVLTLLSALTEVVLDFVERAVPRPLQGVPEARRNLVACLRARDVEAARAEAHKITDAIHHYLEAFAK